MADLLVMRAQVEPHPDNPAVTARQYQPGMVISIQADGFVWHPDVLAPTYHAIVVKIPGVAVADLRHLLAPEMPADAGLGELPTYPRIRQWVLDLDRVQDTMTLDELTAILRRPEPIYMSPLA